MEGKRCSRSDEDYQTSEVKSTLKQNNVNIINNVNIDNINDINNVKSYTKEVTNNYNNKEIKIIYTNADSLTNKMQDLNAFLSTLKDKPNIIAITEVNSKSNKSNMQLSEFGLEGYNIFSSHVGEDKYRGILMYVDKNLISSQFEISEDFEECLFVKVKGLCEDVIPIGCIYRSPNSTVDNNKQLLNLITTFNKELSCKKLLIGDFNFRHVDWLDWTADSASGVARYEDRDFIKCLQDNFLHQHVTLPTRARASDNPHTLDLVISNDDFVSDITHLSPLGKSDHAVLEFRCCYNSKYVVNSSKYNYNKGDYNGLCNYINNNMNKNHESNINLAWENFKDILSDGVRLYVPTIKSSTWKLKPNWKCPLDEDIRKLISKKHRLWTRYIETKDKKYKTTRNLVKKKCKKNDQSKQKEIAKSCKSNPKVFWQYVRSKTNTPNCMGDIKTKDKNNQEIIITNDKDKANTFVDYFSNVFITEPNHPDTIPKLDIPLIAATPMKTLTVHKYTIHEQLLKLKTDKSPGPDNIHPRILKETADSISSSLCTLFNLSLNQGIIPNDWQCSIVTAIHKKGNKSLTSNYRPISLTCISCKIMESLIRNHIMEYFHTNNLFSSKQFGFIKGRSTVLQLLNLIDSWTSSLENGGQIDVIYTDFEKAFDKVPHLRLLYKLQSYGINEQILNWIRGFLCTRKHCVKVNGVLSDWRPVTSGIPQGSVLGPLLFIIYINDLPNECMNLSELFMFADDTKLYKYILNNFNSTTLEQNCQALFNWSQKWLMSLNISKCKVLSIGRRDIIHNSYGFDTPQSGFVQLERVDKMKDLGVTFDDDLSFKSHIYEKINKAYQMLGIMRRNFRHVDKDTFKLIYVSLVRSQLEYAHAVWNPYKIAFIRDLEKVQKRATKLVRACKSLPYRERLIYLNLPSLKYRRIRGDMIEVFKMLNGFYDDQVIPNLTRNHDTRTRGNSFKLSVERPKYNLRKYSFTIRVTKLWNSLPDLVVQAESVNSFKNKIDKCWINEDVYYDWQALNIGNIVL